VLSCAVGYHDGLTRIIANDIIAAPFIVDAHLIFIAPPGATFIRSETSPKTQCRKC